MKNALIITNVSGFLLKFEAENVKILQQMGYRVHFASNKNEMGYIFEPTQLDEIDVVFHHIDIAKSPYMFKMNLCALKQLIEIIKNERIDIIHCHTPVGGVLGRLAARFTKSKVRPRVIYTAHGFHFFKGAPLINNTAYYLVERILAHFTDALIVINNEDYVNASKFHLKPGGRVYIIPGVGIDLTYFSPVSELEKATLREVNGISRDAFFVLSVGEMNQNKNHKVALKAIKIIEEKGNFPGEIHYGICGDGFFKDKIEAFAHNIGLDSRVTFFGYRCNIRDYFAMADLTLFPSIREGLGMAGIESLAMGIPVLASDNRGTREYMVTSQNGYVYDYDDVNGFVNGIYTIKNMSENELHDMQIFCRNSIMRFDQKYARSVMKKVYEAMTGDVSR